MMIFGYLSLKLSKAVIESYVLSSCCKVKSVKG